MFGYMISNNSDYRHFLQSNDDSKKNEIFKCSWSFMPHAIIICFNGKLHISFYEKKNLQRSWLVFITNEKFSKCTSIILITFTLLSVKIFSFNFKNFFNLNFLVLFTSDFALSEFSHIYRHMTRKWTQTD